MQNSPLKHIASTLLADVPVLETDRLRLRGHRLDDFSDSFAMWSDANVTRYILDEPMTEEACWSRFLRYAGHWALLGYGYWVAEEKETGRFVGEIGFADYHREIQPSLNGMPEIGWALAAHAHGKGYATEAVGAATAWGDVHFAASRTACIIAPENVASVRVAEKCGYREFRRATYHGRPAVVFVREPEGMIALE
jgi:RimJ/RimL family protein N-acetyltransferase